MGNASETRMPSLIVEPLASRHDRAAFSRGTPRLDEYLQRYAAQNRKRDLAQCFVLTPRTGTAEIMGYYILSGHAIDDLRQRLDAPRVTRGRAEQERLAWPLPPALCSPLPTAGEGLGVRVAPRSGEGLGVRVAPRSGGGQG